MIIVGVSTTRIPSLSNELLRVIGFREASFTKRNRATHERIDIWSRNDIILDRNRSNSVGTSKAVVVVVVVRKSVVAEINRLSSGIHKPWGILERDGAERESGATPELPRRLFIVLVFVRVHHESVSVRRCWSSRRCLFRLSTGQVLEEEKGDLISDRDRVCVRAGESAYFRVYIPPIQEFITPDSTLTEIYRIRNRLEGRREYQAFRFGVPARRERPEFHVRLVPTTTVRFVGRLSPLLSLSHPLCLSIFLSFSRFCADNERQNESLPFIEARSTEKLAGREFSRAWRFLLPFLFIFSLQIESLCEIW